MSIRSRTIEHWAYGLYRVYCQYTWLFIMQRVLLSYKWWWLVRLCKGSVVVLLVQQHMIEWIYVVWFSGWMYNLFVFHFKLFNAFSCYQNLVEWKVLDFGCVQCNYVFMLSTLNGMEWFNVKHFLLSVLNCMDWFGVLLTCMYWFGVLLSGID